MNDLDTERFIDEVKKRKAIWDTSSEGYNSPIHKVNHARIHLPLFVKCRVHKQNARHSAVLCRATQNARIKGV
jgi:hypothetical protein